MEVLPANESQFIDLDGIQIEFCRIGERDNSKPIIVMLHEGLGCVALWKDFPEQLAAVTGCGVLVYSRQGYGRSSAIDLPRPLNYMHHEAQDVLPTLLDRLDITQAILFGHSDGASISIIYAAEDRPTSLKGLILLAPHVFNEDACVNSIRKAKQMYETGRLRIQLEKYHGENVDAAFWGWNNAWLDTNFLEWNIEKYLDNISVPILLIQGRDDEYGTLEQVFTICKKVSTDVKLMIVSNCKHSPHRDRTDVVLKATENFLLKLLD